MRKMLQGKRRKIAFRDAAKILEGTHETIINEGNKWDQMLGAYEVEG